MLSLLATFPLASFAATPTPGPTSSKTPGDEMNSGLVYGKNHAFWVVAPKGWVLDNQAGVDQGLYAVFYPKGSSWQKSPVVMYANTTFKGVKGQETFQKVVDSDVKQYRDEYHTKKIVNAPALSNGEKNRTAVVKYFLGDGNGNYEACAYIEESKIVVFLVMSAKSQKQFDDNLPAFKALVGSYSFMTDKVKED